VVQKCFKRFDRSFTGEEKVTSPATTSYGIDTNWYADSGATDHITSDLDKLSIRDKYGGNDQVHTASGSGMKIQHIGSTTLHTPSHDLVLNNILHVPTANKNLVSVHRLTLDNHVFLELHPWYFLIKDKEMKKMVHHNRVERGLYPLKASTGKFGLSSVKVSFARWHHRLGHPSPSIVQHVLKNNDLPFDERSSSTSVCDACQKGKMHQLPYPKLSSVSKIPLELVFFDVWGPAPESVGRFKYYVSLLMILVNSLGFILSNINLRCSNVSMIFRTLFQGCLIEFFWLCRLIGVREYHKLNTFFQRIGISHNISCPHAHQQNGSKE
jgi:hypothetical protein